MSSIFISAAGSKSYDKETMRVRVVARYYSRVFSYRAQYAERKSHHYVTVYFHLNQEYQHLAAFAAYEAIYFLHNNNNRKRYIVEYLQNIQQFHNVYNTPDANVASSC